MSLWYDKEAYTLLKRCSDNQDMTEWNAYRAKKNNTPINLRLTNLRDFYLVEANLKNVDLRGTNLRRIECKGADVENANISTDFYWEIYFWIIFLSLLIISLFGLIEVNDMILGMISIIIMRIFTTFHDSSISIPLNPSILFIIILGIIGTLGISIGGIILAVFGNSIGGVIISILGSFIYFSVLLMKYFIFSLNQINNRAILYANNPEESIGFNTKYHKNINISLSKSIEKEIVILKELVAKEKDEKEKKILREKLDKVEKDKESYIIDEADAKTQQIKIQNTLNHILKPYAYIEENIRKLNKHNYFFYGIIMLLIGVFIYAISEHYFDTRANQFLEVIQKDTVSFGAIFGVILFYATPILFGVSIIIYAINQINKNIQNIDNMQEQKRSIEVLQSTLLAQTEIADVSDNEIKALIQALQKGALERMFGQEKASSNSVKESSTYREKLLINNLSKFLTQAVKK